MKAAAMDLPTIRCSTRRSALGTLAQGTLALGALLAMAPTAAIAAPAFLEALFAPAARPWPRWEAHDPAATRIVDHAAWDRFLRDNLRRRPDGVMGVTYGSVSQEAKAALRRYLDVMAGEPVSRLSRPEQLAYWINLYNALTVRVMLDAWPVASIRDISLSSGLFETGPWSAKVIVVEGQDLTLNDIEHRILRPIWRDARIHYAVNCASIGCPDLRQAAFTGAGAAAMLDQAARDYIGHPRGVTATPDGLVLSSIYNWFAEDFGGEAGVLPHIRGFASPTLLAAIDRAPRIAGYRYDWAANLVASGRS